METPRNPHAGPTTQELLDEGSLIHVQNCPMDQGLHETFVNAKGEQDYRYTQQYEERADLLRTLRERYGYHGVVTGNALNPETGTASGLPYMLGVYITAEAYDAAQSEKE